MNIVAAIRREERKLQKQVSKLQQQLGGLSAAAKALGGSANDGLGKTQKRVLSAAGRAKISAAAKRRWARARAGTKRGTQREAATGGSAKAQKRVMSTAARARISRAMKQRWAKVGAGAKKAVS
jgi:hypothetical protein